MSGRDKKIPILMYHEVYRSEDRDLLRNLTNPAYNTELTFFRRQMAWLSSKRFKTLTLDELLSEKWVRDRNAICLTFDDGWLGNYLHAYPVLSQYGFKATLFVATGLIGTPFHMTWEHLREIVAGGMSVQSHTVTHRPLGGMSETDALSEVSESKRTIEEKLGTKVGHLSLPHGLRNARVWAFSKELGYKSISTSDVGFHTTENNGPWLKRINIGDKISMDQFQLIAQGENHAILGMRAVKGVKNMIRGSMGISNYRKLYRLIYSRETRD
jgi:peptidoglycan/xylan/chitin deacetylase (PgdA/CDA1 family)